MTEPRDNRRLRKATDELLDPKNDYVFKRLFVRRPQLLVALINAVRPDAPPVRCVEIRNPGIDGEELGAKAIVLDILAQDQSGHLYDIEMQVRETEAWNLRSLFYLARLLGQELHAGQDHTGSLQDNHLFRFINALRSFQAGVRRSFRIPARS